jgi:enterochelin esterase family protein
MKKLLLLFLSGVALQAQTHPLQALIEAARTNSPALKSLFATTVFDLKERGAAAVWGQDFLFAIETGQVASVSVDKQTPMAMTRVPDSNIWYRLTRLRLGVTHNYHFYADGKPLAVAHSYDVPGYGPDSYPQPSVPKGTLSEKKTLASKLYPNMPVEYWVYVSPGYDASRGAALMVWQDGQNLARGDLFAFRLFTVTENLVQKGLIPPMIHVMVAPGDRTRMRSIQYDTVSDRYGRFLLEELLPEVEKSYKLRSDGYSRAIGGLSSGGICALNAAMYFPDRFSRVLSGIGSYVALQWHPEQQLDGGNIYPFKIRREPKRNIRVWMSDGADDQEGPGGSWPLQNIQLANSLKLKGYDFHFRFGEGMHANAQAALDLPDSLIWLWRDYDAAKTQQTYEMEPSEREKPVYRVRIVNRDAW